MKTHCSLCEKEVEIETPGKYTDILSCGHITVKSNTADVIKSSGTDAIQAESISKELTKNKELPKIDGNELVMRVLGTVNQKYEDFFSAENPIIEDIIKEHGKDNAVLIFTAIHAHLSKTLFGINRFRNIYYIMIEKLRKEIEDKAVKDLIQNHDFFYSDLAKSPNPKKPKTIGGRINTELDKAKTSLKGLTDKDGNPVDVTKVLANLMWKKDKEKEDYKKGLDEIKDSITKKEPEKE